ncbi:fibronectin type III domain-containing protein [Jatrophihabitans sp. YIM 134969]
MKISRARVVVALVAALLGSVSAGVQPAQAVGQQPGTYVALSPARLLDTRSGNGAARAPVGAGGTVDLQVTGRGGVPATGVSAVLLNVTVTNPKGSGYITAFPTGQQRPTASNLNFVPRQTVPNLVAVRLGSGGRVSLFNGSGGTVDLLADVAGYYVDGAAVRPGTFEPLLPSRLLDTRSGYGAPPGPVGRGSTVTFQAVGGIIPSNASAVLLNVTVTNVTGSGYITAYPDGSTRPTASSLNFAARRTVPNLVAVKVGADGRVALYNGSGGNVDLLADIAGYVNGGTPVTDVGAFAALPPTRVLDTRSGNGAPAGRVSPGGTVQLPVTGRGGVPATGVAAVLLNVTAVSPTGAGYLTVYPSGGPRPTASNLNFGVGDIRANLVAARVGAGGTVALYNGSGGTVDVLADVAGYVLASAPDTNAPAPVTNVAVPAFTDHSVTLTWTNPSDADFAGVIVRRAVGPNPPTSPTAGTAVADTAASTFVDTGVTSGTTYSYALFAHDTSGNYATRATSPAVVTDYAPVTNARTTAVTSSSVTLAWTRSADASASRVEIRRAQGSTPPASSSAGALVADTDATTVTDSGLAANTPYAYALFAHDVEGREAAPATVTARTAVVTPPNGIVASVGTVDWTKDSVYDGGNWATPDVVHEYAAGAGRVGVATYHPSSGSLTAQTFDPVSHSQIGATVTRSTAGWPVWGGFYAAPTGDFYVALGKDNPDQDDHLDVVAIRRYSADWTLLGTAYVEGGATQASLKGIYEPFAFGAAHMVLTGTTLVLHMSRTIYAIQNVHHQANLTIQVDVSTMTATPFADLGGAPSASHSFQQLVAMNGSSLVAIDHGDTYPRAVELSVFANYPSQHSLTTYDLLDFNPRDTDFGNNYTGATVTGLVSGPSGIVVTGNSIHQPGPVGSEEDHEVRNVYIVAADPASGAHTLTWLTSFPAAGTTQALEPRVVQVAADRFAVLFTVTTGGAVRTEYRLIDSAGVVQGSATFEGFRFDAGTDPVHVGSAVYWTGRPASGSTGYVYGIDVSDPTSPHLLGS